MCPAGFLGLLPLESCLTSSAGCALQQTAQGWALRGAGSQATRKRGPGKACWVALCSEDSPGAGALRLSQSCADCSEGLPWCRGWGRVLPGRCRLEAARQHRAQYFVFSWWGVFHTSCRHSSFPFLDKQCGVWIFLSEVAQTSHVGLFLNGVPQMSHVLSCD